jgi:hypothetical protein
VLLLVLLLASWAGGDIPAHKAAGGSQPEAGDIVSMQALPPVPAVWPSSKLELGVNDGPGGAADWAATAPFKFRYQYLAGGANTGNGWATWNTNGQFATYYIQDSIDYGFVPTFTYYMIYQSSPGNGQGEYDGVYNNLNNTQTMTAYWNDVKLFMQRAGAFPQTKVLFHVEPDMWGYIHLRATNDNATTVSAKVAATGISDLAGLPNNAAGVAQAFDRLRDLYAPNVILGYHNSLWASGADFRYTPISDAEVDAQAGRAATFFNSLGGQFDVTFGEFTDRDAAFKQYQYGDGGAAWFDSGDYHRHQRFFAKYSELAQQRIVMWQIPFGNTKMRAMNNTWGHYQDNIVQTFLDDGTRAMLTDYANGGTIAFLFGMGAGGVTCPCDANGDGVTNPAAINGNTTLSYNADDDGGFFRNRAVNYYSVGAMTLPGGGGGSTDADRDGFQDRAQSLHTAPANVDRAYDNCPGMYNPDQLNHDGNLIELGPSISFDDATNGLSDIGERTACSQASIGTDPLRADTDGDRVMDGAECSLGTDPTSPSLAPIDCTSASDQDGDGLLDGRERCFYGTSPSSQNTDGDSCGDRREVMSINADATVNALDLAQVAAKFGRYAPSSPSYLVEFDVSKDGTIGGLDLGLVAAAFGPC